jgi:hypothetical protein
MLAQPHRGGWDAGPPQAGKASHVTAHRDGCENLQVIISSFADEKLGVRLGLACGVAQR